MSTASRCGPVTAVIPNVHLVDQGSYYIQGTSPTARKSHSYTGPHSDDWQATDTTELAAIVYHPCGEQRLFNIDTELRVSAGSSDTATTTSFMSMDSTDGGVETTYHFARKTCP